MAQELKHESEKLQKRCEELELERKAMTLEVSASRVQVMFQVMFQ